MQHRSLGNSGIQVSVVGFGAWAIGGNAHGNSYGSTDDEISLAALQTAYKQGCNFYDTADVYGHGHSEELIGKALQQWPRESVVIATKVGGDFYGDRPRMNFTESYIRFALEKSLKRLNTDYIDLYQLHNPTLAMIQSGEVFNTLKALKQEGKIRCIGLSIFDPQEGMAAIPHGVECIQAVYNLFDRRPEDVLLPACKEKGIGFIAREPLANGFLTAKYTAQSTFESGDIRSNWPAGYIEKRVKAADAFHASKPERYPGLAPMALGFVLSHPMVSSAIPGCKTPEQAIQNCHAASIDPLRPDELTRLDEAFLSLV